MFDTKIPFYNIAILASLVTNVIVVLVFYKKFRLSKDEMIGALVYENCGIIIGAKFLTFLSKYNYNNFDFWNLGLSSYGGIIGAIICLIIFSIQFKKSLKDILLSFMPSIPLMYAIGKIGCFIVGCCHGIEYSGLGNVIYNYSHEATHMTHYFPIQIVEAFVFLLLFIYIINNVMKNKFDLKKVGISFVLCGIAKFLLDFLRISNVGIILSLNQVLSLIFILIGVLIIIYNIKKRVSK